MVLYHFLFKIFNKGGEKDEIKIIKFRNFKLSASTDENNNLVTMDTELNFIKGTREIKATDTQMRTLIQSVIPAGTKAVGGQYIGTGTFAASLTVK